MSEIQSFQHHSTIGEHTIVGMDDHGVVLAFKMQDGTVALKNMPSVIAIELALKILQCGLTFDVVVKGKGLKELGFTLQGYKEITEEEES
jgi:hypothetical protein